MVVDIEDMEGVGMSEHSELCNDPAICVIN